MADTATPAGPPLGTHGPDGGRRWTRRSARDRRARVRLELIEGEGVVVLNDRRIPGSRASLKHVVVAPAGVFVLEAKDVKGLVHTKRPGPFSAHAPDELHVGRHDFTPLVGNMTRQIEEVRTALRGTPWADEIPVSAMLCLTRAQWGFASPLELGEVWVGWPQMIEPRIKSPVIMDTPMVKEVSSVLSDHLPSG